MHPDKFDHLGRLWSASAPWVYDAVAAVSDDHNAERGRHAVRAVVDAVLAEVGPEGLTGMAVELTFKLAEALERIAAEQGLAAVDLAEVWFVE
jgi:hypothetical protein